MTLQLLEKTIWDECKDYIGTKLSSFKEQVQSTVTPVDDASLEQLLILVSTTLETLQQNITDCAGNRKPNTSIIEYHLVGLLLSESSKLGFLNEKIKLLTKRLKRVWPHCYYKLHFYFLQLAAAFVIIHETSHNPEDFFIRFEIVIKLYAAEFINIKKQIINLDSYKT